MKYFFFSRIVISLVLTAGLVVGCATTSPRIQQVTPITLGPEGSTPITFTRLIIRIPSGTDVGSHHDGLLKVPKFRHTWQSSLIVASDEFKIIACEQLRSRGYTVMGGDTLLFGKDQSGKAEYQLGGTLQSLRFDTYAPLAGNYSESNIMIEWQLYDVFKEKVIYKRTSTGYGRQHGIGIASIQSAFRSALDDLLGDAEFVTVIKKSPHQVWQKGPEALTLIDIAKCSQQPDQRLPKDLEVVMKSVLLIRAGTSTGSGIVIAQDGYALTAAHLVSGLKEVVVQLHSGIELTASIVRIDPQQDVALIRLPGRGHSCLLIATGSLPKVGSDVFAIGAPGVEKLAFSVTK